MTTTRTTPRKLGAYTTLCGVTAEAYDVDGITTLLSVLSPCCKAPVDGSDGPRCTSCTRMMPPGMGGSPWHALKAAANWRGCPRAEDCATHTLWRFEQGGVTL